MAKSVTIELSNEAAEWARKKAAEEKTSLSELVGRLLEEEMRRTDAHWKAFDEWQRCRPLALNGVAHCLTRDLVHERH